MALTNEDWRPFGIADEDYGPAEPGAGVRMLNLTLDNPASVKDRAGKWLRNAMIALAVLAAAAAVVSFEAQYRMVWAAKHGAAVAALEAGIPDVSALVFASLGIALALHGKRAIRARLLNVGAVATSIGMNALAAGPGWRDAAIWIMPPVAYALASDTAIGVVRAYTLARQRALDEDFADDEATPLAVLSGMLLWLLRLMLAPPSTLRGFRTWVVEETPVAPGRKAALELTATAKLQAEGEAAVGAHRAEPPTALVPVRAGTKTARFLTLVAEQYGPLEALPIEHVSRISSELAPEVGLNPGSARAALRARVVAVQNGSAS